MPSYAHEPEIIILTHSGSEQDRERAIALGANGFLTKPDSIDAYVRFFKEQFE
jgi:CheY-like chemotaxis protein